MTKAILVAQFLRARAWWRLDSAGASALPVARSVVSLLDAAGYARGLPDDDPAITALDAAGCFSGGIFDPGPQGWTIVREWQLADEASAGPEDLLGPAGPGRKPPRPAPANGRTNGQPGRARPAGDQHPPPGGPAEERAQTR